MRVESVDLTPLGMTLPSDRVGMVVAQPYLQLTETEPFRCLEANKPAQLCMIEDTLAVALAVPQGVEKTHFTIFPEYSIPGLDGVELIQRTLQGAEWPSGTFVIGGTDALTKTEFASLATAPHTCLDQVANAIDRVGEDEWVNCSIIWLKTAQGEVKRWLQPKLKPAWDELNIINRAMFKGASVFSFRGPLSDQTHYRFSSLICFDWISEVNGRAAWWWPLDALNQQAQAVAAHFALSWFFVIQHNPAPSHPTFLNQTSSFFDQRTLPSVLRDQACLIFANTAGKDRPGKVGRYGSSSLIFTKRTLFAQTTAAHTFSNGGGRFRGSSMLGAFVDVYLREGGACIHSFAQVNPSSLLQGAGGRQTALDRAFVFPLYSNTDPRAPSTSVPASVKWVNDELDNIDSLAELYGECPLAEQISSNHSSIVSDLRRLPADQSAGSVKLAVAGTLDASPDEWDDRERQAVRHLVHSLEILKLSYLVEVEDASPAHAKMMRGEKPIDVIAVRGKSHEACIAHLRDVVPTARRQTLLVSRDDDNTAWRKRFDSILNQGSATIGGDVKITDPAGSWLRVAYHTLLEKYQDCQSVVDLQGAIDASIS